MAMSGWGTTKLSTDRRTTRRTGSIQGRIQGSALPCSFWRRASEDSMRNTLFVIAFILLLSDVSRAQSQRLAVPAYFPLATSCNAVGPGCSKPALGSDWLRIQRAGSVVQIVVADGSFKGISGNGLSAAQTQFVANGRAGQLVLGYVDTTTGSRKIDCSDGTDVPPGTPAALPGCGSVMEDVAQWYANYQIQIGGIFFDNG